MVFARITRAETQRRLIREVQSVRLRQTQALSQDYRATLIRLDDAYVNIIKSLSARLDDFASATPQNTRTRATALLGAVQSELDTLRGVIVEESTRLQSSGVLAGYRTGLTNLTNGGLTTRYSAGTLDTIRSAINYVDSAPFQDAVNRLAGYHSTEVGDLILRALTQGKNPRDTARLIRDYLLTSKRPLQDALRMTRTTQIYSARGGTQAIYERTGITQWIWSAALDSRTCLACVAMHGTVHPISEPLNDHHNGRCSAVPVTPTWQQLGFTGGSEPTFETGVAWFNRQPDSVQSQMMGPGLFRAYQQGKFTFSPDVVVGVYSNPVFGMMRRLKTNAEILGSNPLDASP